MVSTYCYKYDKSEKPPCNLSISIVIKEEEEEESEKKQAEERYNIFVNENINLCTLLSSISLFLGISENNKEEVLKIISSIKIILKNGSILDGIQCINIKNKSFCCINIESIIIPFKLKMECCVCYEEIDFLKEHKFLHDILNFKCSHYVCKSCYIEMKMRKLEICPLCRSN